MPKEEELLEFVTSLLYVVCSTLLLHHSANLIYSGSVWRRRMTSSSCSLTEFPRRSLTGWHPPSPGGFGSLCGAPTRSPNSAALCTRCRLGYLWKGEREHLFLLYLPSFFPPCNNISRCSKKKIWLYL